VIVTSGRVLYFYKYEMRFRSNIDSIKCTLPVKVGLGWSKNNFRIIHSLKS
jgi:hypothetical protein